MDFQIITQSSQNLLTFNKNTDIRSNIWLSLNIKQGSFFQNTSFGSKLYLVKKITDSNILLAKQYVQDSLKWLITIGKASSINAIVEKDSNNISQMNISIQVVQPNGITIFYQQFSDVRTGKITFVQVGGPESTFTTP